VREIVDRALSDSDEAASGPDGSGRASGAPTVVCVGCGRRGLVHSVHVACSRARVDAVALTADAAPPPTSAVDHVDVRAVAGGSGSDAGSKSTAAPASSGAEVGERAGGGDAGSGADGPRGVDGVREALESRTAGADLVIVTGDRRDPVSVGLVGVVVDTLEGPRGPHVVSVVEDPGAGAGHDAGARPPSTIVGASDLAILVPPDAWPPAGPAGLAGDVARDLAEAVRPETASELTLADLQSLGPEAVGRLSVVPLGGGRSIEDALARLRPETDPGRRDATWSEGADGRDDGGDAPIGTGTGTGSSGSGGRGSGSGSGSGSGTGSSTGAGRDDTEDRQTTLVEDDRERGVDRGAGLLALVCAGPDAPRQRAEVVAAAVVRDAPASGRVLWDARLARHHARGPHVKLLHTRPASAD
jgi:hypothetical protein